MIQWQSDVQIFLHRQSVDFRKSINGGRGQVACFILLCRVHPSGVPRPTRIEYEHAYYHVMNRGRVRQTVFRDGRYYRAFLDTWHAPETECIGIGKADKPYEFGCKVSVMTNINAAPGGHFVLHVEALHDRPFDGHTLKPIIEDY